MEGREENEVAAVVEKRASLSPSTPTIPVLAHLSVCLSLPKSFSFPPGFLSNEQSGAGMLAVLSSLLLHPLPKRRRVSLGRKKSRELFAWFSLSLPAELKVSLSIRLGMLHDESFKNSESKIKKEMHFCHNLSYQATGSTCFTSNANPWEE